jgi:apolipoprotein N-acyltransferase
MRTVASPVPRDDRISIPQGKEEEPRAQSRWRERAAALVFGMLPALAFPEPAWWWSAFVALVPLLFIVVTAQTGREATLRTWLGGTGFFLAISHWLLPKVGPGLIPIALLLGLVWIPWGWIAWRGSRARTATLAVLVPSAAWVAGEFARSSEYLGGPWGLLGASQWNNFSILELASLSGVWGVSFVVCSTNVAITLALFGKQKRSYAVRALATGATLICATLVYGWLHDVETNGSLSVAGVQPGVVHHGGKRFERGLSATRSLPRVGYDLLVWGESSVGAAGAQPSSMTKLEDAATTLDSPLLVNIDKRRGSTGIFKSSVLIDDGIVGSYDKIRLVPFGEYIPFRSVFGWLPNISDAPLEDRSRGGELSILDTRGLAIGPLVCFESAFPDMSRSLAAKGANVIVVQSATTTFQESWAPEQHAALAAVRAVESGRAVIHATLSGVSAAFDATGRRHVWFETERTGTYTFTIPLSAAPTPYVRWGDWLPLAAIALALAGAVVLRRPS